ncbi:hypothetical protein [Parasphingopyxis lamellibrachiae]|uniref:Uncharacterized protein n=1 Tax=Parasphingopyxis lamellibrachiae TaxID=680125 RepID=A0A3D9FDS3_9SPHN|nr:hypothetical protein [Parasphingopyxis lamellibrachiae]RED15727.1 hypothetical protein DFR46_0730 [Parasphingopyxis lamellibrachiae]
MLFSRLKKRRDAKKLVLSNRVKESFQRLAGLTGDVHRAVAAYHAAVFRRSPQAHTPSRSDALGDLLTDLEEAADDQGTWSRVFDDLTLTHCNRVRQIMRAREELESTAPPSRHLVRRIEWLTERTEKIGRDVQRLEQDYRKAAETDE